MACAAAIARFAQPAVRSARRARGAVVLVMSASFDTGRGPALPVCELWMSWPHSRAGGRWRRPLREGSASPARGICSALGVCRDRRVPRPRELLSIGAGRRRCRPACTAGCTTIHGERCASCVALFPDRAVGPDHALNRPVWLMAVQNAREAPRPIRPTASASVDRSGASPRIRNDSASRSHVMEWAHRRTQCVRPVWFASDSTPQIRGLIRPRLAGSPASRGGVQDDRARTTEHAERAPPRPQRGTGRSDQK